MHKCECGCGRDVRAWNRFVNGHHMRGKHLSDKHKKKLSEASKGRVLSKESRKKIGDAQRGEKHHRWKGGVSFEPYCHKFNNKFKEMIRDKFDRVCFLCGKTEEDNNIKLSVHHVQYNKNCGCDDSIACDYVPLCNSCHAKTSNGDREYYESLIQNKLVSFL